MSGGDGSIVARLAWVVPLSLLLIFLLLFISLRTIKSTVMVFANLPFALVGGIAAIFLLRLNLSVSAIIGFIALFGIAVQNGLVLVSFFDQLRGEGLATPAAVLEACRLRVRPLVMTTLTTVLGLLPILVSAGPGADMQKPLVAVMFGGLISSLALTLFLLPVLYTLLNRTELPVPPSGRGGG